MTLIITFAIIFILVAFGFYWFISGIVHLLAAFVTWLMHLPLSVRIGALLAIIAVLGIIWLHDYIRDYFHLGGAP